ncbi:MAG TPA: SDR family NAD(P)-dependent oxidoreductase [Dehalococcoidia bacterium]|nr:SDR family NAD(P)-dependent oxidoreductase [Dehalococcoidia bacterium]
MDLNGARVWLLGASSGIGAALVPELTRAGAKLAISARREDALQRVAERWGTTQRPIVVKPLDVTERYATDRAADELRQLWGAIDVLIYGAGDWEVTDVARFDVDAIERQIMVNYVGLVRAVGAVLPAMLERRRGQIVGIASLSGYRGLPRAEAYGSTKAAANVFLQSLRIDTRHSGISVTTVNPGFVRTRLTAKNDFPMPFLLTPQQAARSIVLGIRRDKAEVHFPLRLSVPLKLFTALPRPVYEWALTRGRRPSPAASPSQASEV